MGFFSKIFKGIKKVVKKVGKGIKSAVAKVGKFMDKAGIAGQIALAFILPGIGQALGRGLGALGQFGASLGGTMGNIIQGAAKFATTVGRTFQTVTAGVKNFIGELGKTAASKLGFNVTNAATNFFGADGAFAKAFGETKGVWNNSTWGFTSQASTEAFKSGTEGIINELTQTRPPITDSSIIEGVSTEVVEGGSLLTPPPLEVTPLDAEVPTPDFLEQPFGTSGLEQSIKEGVVTSDFIDLEDMQASMQASVTESFKPRPTLYEAAKEEVTSFAGRVKKEITTSPIRTALSLGRAATDYISSTEESTESYYGDGDPMLMPAAYVSQADPIQFIQAGTPYGYAQGLYDNIYRGGAWQRSMAGGF